MQAVAGGLLTALALPPWGWWPLAFVGIALLESSLGEFPTRRQRFGRAWLFAAAWLYLGMCWMWFLTIPGYLLAVPLFACFHGAAALVAPTGRWRVIGRPLAPTLAEALRFSFPFGGVPLASLPIGQAAGPFVGVVQVGGAEVLRSEIEAFAIRARSHGANVRLETYDGMIHAWHGFGAILEDAHRAFRSVRRFVDAH